jgi:phage terminase large subunit-like protein
LTISPPAALLGAQQPRVSSTPAAVSSAGQEAAELAASAGLELDPWQCHILDGALGERADGKWSAFEVGVILPRQNGKGAVLEARELAGLFLFGERLILHSAHEFKTAQEAFRRVLSLVENTDFLRKRVARVRTSHGEEGIELLDGARLRFVARSGGSGRGFSGDTVILDEAMILGPEAMAALLPTLSARPNPQLWYAASAGMDSSQQLRMVRERGQRGDDPGLAFFEWSADPSADLDDHEAWAQANPALGIRIPEEFIERERAAMPELEFARERLGIWDDGRRDAVIPLDIWERCADSRSKALDPVAFAVDVPPDRGTCSIGAAGRRSDGLAHVEVVEHRKGTAWAVERLAELTKWNPAAIVLDPAGPAGSLLPDLEAAGVDVTKVSGREMAQACGTFYDLATDLRLRHLDQPMLNSALGAARKRNLGDAWAWHRRDLTDISPLVACTLALFGHASSKPAQTFVPRRVR